MFSKLIVLTITLTVLSLTNGQTIGLQKCSSEVQALPELSVADYLGTWYEYAKYPTPFQSTGNCVAAQYTLREDGYVGVNNTQINSETGEFENIVGYAYVVEGGKLEVVFPDAFTFGPANYWVLGTDYNTYSVVYSCQRILGIRFTFVWILTRERSPSPTTINNAFQVLTNNGISFDGLTITNQCNCN